MSNGDAESFQHEYESLQAGLGVVKLAAWSSISVTGADRHAFLNNFCTNDVKRLVPCVFAHRLLIARSGAKIRTDAQAILQRILDEAAVPA